MAETQSFPVPLRPLQVSGEQSADSLTNLISQMNQERGHFRNFTEESLRKQINDEAESKSSEVDSDDGSGSKTEDVDQRRKELYEAKMELIKYAAAAQNEALTALDFVSLLMKKDDPVAAGGSMSPFLKQNLPIGELGTDKLEPQKHSEAETLQNKQIATGFTLQSLNRSADLLLQSATKLEAEMDKEAQYWHDVLSITKNNWPLRRVAGERHAIGVQFGSMEASPSFYAQGTAILRPGDDGSLILDRGLSRSLNAIELTIRDSKGNSKTSSMNKKLGADSKTIDVRLYQARNSLFDEELFQELIREARTLLAYRITVIDGIIHIPAESSVGEDSEITIALIPIEDDDLGPTDSSADLMLLALRIGMTNVYRQRFRARTQVPLPLSDVKKDEPILNLIHSMMTMLRHRSATEIIRRRAEQYADNIRLTIPDCGITHSIAGSSTATSSKQTAMEALVASLTSDWHAVTSITLPMSTVTIRTKTALAPPEYGTVYTLVEKSADATSHEVSLSSTEQLFALLEKALRKAIDTIPPSYVES